MLNKKSKNTDKSLPDYQHGTTVAFEVGGHEVQGIFSHWTPQNDGYLIFNGKNYWRKYGKFRLLQSEDSATLVGATYKEDTQEEESTLPSAVAPAAPLKKWTIQQRFGFLESLTRMVIKKQLSSLLITGDGGLGKTEVVIAEFDKLNLKEYNTTVIDMDDNSRESIEEEDSDFTSVIDYDYIAVSGYSSDKGIYKLLYLHREKTLIFDDCDQALMSATAVSLLKVALDSNPRKRRIITWESTTQLDGLPTSFEFKGRVIFISNRKKAQIPQPMLSRATSIDFTMTPEEKIERMSSVLANVRKDVDMSIKTEVIEMLDEHKYHAKDLNFRTLLKAISIKTSDEDNRDELAEYMVLS